MQRKFSMLIMRIRANVPPVANLVEYHTFGRWVHTVKLDIGPKLSAKVSAQWGSNPEASAISAAFRSFKLLPRSGGSGDRTKISSRSLSKWEYFQYRPETFRDLPTQIAKLGRWRLMAGARKPAIGGPFSRLRRGPSEHWSSWLTWEDSN
jgi:hypothetical protein